MTTDLRIFLAAADPARDPAYDDTELDALAASVLSAAATSASPSVAKPAGWWTPRRRTAVALVAALAALIIVVPAVFDGSAGTKADAAVQLDRAADAIVLTDPPARGDQYWRLTTQGTGLAVKADSAGVTSLLIAQTATEYVAVDGSRPTYTVTGVGHLVRQLSGPPQSAEQVATSAPAGVMTSDLAPNDVVGDWQTPTPTFLRELPRDPAALMTRLRTDSRDEGRSPNGEVFVFVADVLRSGLVPSDLRGALYRVLAELPGVSVAASNVDLGSGNGMAFAYDEQTDGSQQEIVVDLTDGSLVGEREVETRATDDLPAGTVIGQSTTRRDLVDTIPADVIAAATVLHCTINAGGGASC